MAAARASGGLLAAPARGVSRRIETDLVERFFVLVEQHTLARQKRWERDKETIRTYALRSKL